MADETQPGIREAAAPQAEGGASTEMIGVEALTVQADTVNMNRSSAQTINAEQVSMERSAVRTIDATSVDLDDCAVAQLSAEEARLDMSPALIVSAGQAHLQDSPVLILMGNTEGNVRPILTLSTAAILGVTFGAGLAIVSALVRITSGRK